ncbi:glycosyltransferase family 4 protein [Bradyrhizobium commune]|uniref:glycosyltransferase family 4 protein n=1 Tax=Bradyrhizobium commune TaxID=83627 RepID=UPI001FEEA64E|nr:glycosyltransferase family 4 protein [Bradyrhizobium commune]
MKNGHTVDVHCIGHESGLPSSESMDGIVVFRYPMDAHYKIPRFKAMKRAWPTIFRYALHVRRVAKETSYDVLFLNQWPLLHAVALPQSQRAKAVIHWCEIRTGLFYRVIQALLPRIVARNVAVSDSVGRSIARFCSGSVRSLPSGLDVEHYQSLPRIRRSGICFIGRMTAHKNIPLLIDAFELLKDQGYAGALTLAGDGPVLEEVRTRAMASRHASSIFLPGLISENDKIDLLSRSEVLAISSLREGFPRVVAEAMASGLPVVTCDYEMNGTKDIVRSYNCGLVTQPTPDCLAQGVRDLMAHWDHFSRTGHLSAKTLSWALIAESFEEMVGSTPINRSASHSRSFSEAKVA